MKDERWMVWKWMALEMGIEMEMDTRFWFKMANSDQKTARYWIPTRLSNDGKTALTLG
jgi:hypothetical protein